MGHLLMRGHVKCENQVQDDIPWLVFGWCVAHKLELGIQGALKSTYFDKVDRLLLCIYYFINDHQSSSDNFLRSMILWRRVIKFDASCIKPVKTSGSHWIAHNVGALKKLLYKYSIYIIHLQSLCKDKSYLEKERSKFKEYLKQW